MPRIIPYEDRWQPGAAAVVRSVFEEYGFAWDPDDYHRDLYTVREAYLDTGGFFSVLVDGEKVIGTVGGLDRGDFAELERLYLLPTHRGRGYGRLMVELFIDWARRKGRHRLIAWSDKRFDTAHRLYERLGFKIVGDRICNDPDNSPEWCFELRLDRQDAPAAQSATEGPTQ